MKEFVTLTMTQYKKIYIFVCMYIKQTNTKSDLEKRGFKENKIMPLKPFC